jgi:hypothetical protein
MGFTCTMKAQKHHKGYAQADHARAATTDDKPHRFYKMPVYAAALEKAARRMRAGRWVITSAREGRFYIRIEATSARSPRYPELQTVTVYRVWRGRESVRRLSSVSGESGQGEPGTCLYTGTAPLRYLRFRGTVKHQRLFQLLNPQVILPLPKGQPDFSTNSLSK